MNHCRKEQWRGWVEPVKGGLDPEGQEGFGATRGTICVSCRDDSWRIGAKNHSTETQLQRARMSFLTQPSNTSPPSGAQDACLGAGFYHSRVELALGGQQNVQEFLHGSGVGGGSLHVSVLVYVHVNVCTDDGQDSFRCHSYSLGFCFVYFWFLKQGFSV